MNPAPITISDRTPRLGNGWEWVPLGDVAQLATGHTPDRSVPGYWNGGIPWISLTEIRDLDGRLADRTELNVSRAGPSTLARDLNRLEGAGLIRKMGRSAYRARIDRMSAFLPAIAPDANGDT